MLPIASPSGHKPAPGAAATTLVAEKKRTAYVAFVKRHNEVQHRLIQLCANNYSTIVGRSHHHMAHIYAARLDS